jgi:UDP-N-acetylglucosamine--N-acetylmuramyl-(pentapeptide) pyrophosphoryl-undecaprenol N-acetylglucosamine transferase
MPRLKEEGIEIVYIGSYHGIEKNLIKDTGIPYYGIASGKLRRYFSLKNITDPFRVIKGCSQAYRIIRKEKPNLVFSKGGFVSVPVIMAAKLLHVPIVIHESDMTPGLANKISLPFANKICTSFEETLNYVPKDKAIHTGGPIRQELLNGHKKKGYALCGFNEDRPVIMMIGGSLGSVIINKVLRDSLDRLLKDYQLVHLCGKGNLAPALENTSGYKQFEYVKEDLPHLFAMADIVISRAGANVISELLALKKPNILIPLSQKASRGDQILNANSYKRNGFSTIIEEEALTVETLLKTINSVNAKKQVFINNMEKDSASKGVDNIIEVILATLK